MDIVKAGVTISILNAAATIRDRFLKIDADKWSRVMIHDQVIDTINKE